MSPPSPAGLQPAEREACLAQLKLLSAQPELLSRPEYADVVLWAQRVAALARPADPAVSGKKLAAAVPSRIPAPPTRRAIAFPSTTKPSTSPESPHVADGESDPATAATEATQEEARCDAASPVAPTSPARSERSVAAVHSSPSSAGRKASPCTPSRLTPPKSVRRVARHARGQSLESDTSSTSLSMHSPLAPPKSVRRAAGHEQRISVTPEPPSPPKSLRKVTRSVARSPLAPPPPAPPPPPGVAAAIAAAAAAPESPPLLRSTPARVLRNTPARQARANSPHPATPRSAPRPKSAMRSAAKGTPAKRTPARGGTPSRRVAPPPASPPPPSPAPPPAATAEARGAGDGGAAPELELGSFPATFQHGTGAEQLRMLHAALRDAAAPIGLEAIAARLPPGKFTLARLSILLEVMESRKVVATDKSSSASVRWQLRA